MSALSGFGRSLLQLFPYILVLEDLSFFVDDALFIRNSRTDVFNFDSDYGYLLFISLHPFPVLLTVFLHFSHDLLFLDFLEDVQDFGLVFIRIDL